MKSALGFWQQPENSLIGFCLRDLDPQTPGTTLKAARSVFDIIMPKNIIDNSLKGDTLVFAKTDFVELHNVQMCLKD